MFTVIGAGLSGLYAAYLLHKQNQTVTVLEARERPGGRIHGHAINSADSVELGPSWFWPHQHHIQQLCKSLSVPTFTQYIEGEALYQIAPNQPVQRFYGTGGMTSFRVAGGLTSLIQALIQQLPPGTVKYNQAVISMKRKDKGWQVNTGDSVFEAERLIVATPPRVALTQFGFGDHIPEPLHNELHATPTWMAAQAKFIATYKTPFWREQGLSGDAFSRVGPMVEIHDASVHENDGFALFGFIGIPALQRNSINTNELKQACLNQLVSLFGDEAKHVVNLAIEDWSKQPFTCTDTDIRTQPEHPHCDLSPYSKILSDLGVAIASTEVATREAGYLEGAIVSAKEAVELLTKI